MTIKHNVKGGNGMKKLIQKIEEALEAYYKTFA